MSFELEKLPNGDLKLKIVQDEEDWDYIFRHGSDNGLWDLMEGYIGNGWSVIDANQTGDMTDAPMICDDFTVEDNGDEVVYGNVWAFLNYQVEDPLETLRDKGEVVFQRLHEAGELIPFEYTKMAALARPHGLCEQSRTCLEHKQDKKVPSCKKRGKGRRTL